MRRKAKLIFLIILFTLIVISDVQVMAKEGDSSLKKHKWALQFGIKKDLTLGSFEAGDISFKRQMNSKSALRFGITIYYSYSENSSQKNEYGNDISIIYQRYVNPMSRAKFYWGTGPYFRFSYSRRESSSDTTYRKQINETWGFGIIGLAGIEWFATSVISFHAEY